MLMHVYSFYDTASGSYMRPFVAQADGEATRVFMDLVSDPEHPIGKHPEDYSIFRLGSFNDQSGDIGPEDPIECLSTGLEMVALKRNQDG